MINNEARFRVVLEM